MLPCFGLYLPSCSKPGSDAFGGQATEQKDREQKGTERENKERGITEKENSGQVEREKEKTSEKQSVLVKATQLMRGPIRSFLEVSADIESLNHVDIYPHLSGIQVTEVFVEEGDLVDKGKVLARLETSEIELELAQAKVNYVESKHRLEKARIAVKEAKEREAKARIQSLKSESDFKKSKNMFKNELISEDEYAADRLTWEEAVSELDLATLQKEQANLDLQLAGTEADRYKIAVDNTSIKLSRTEIVAPFNGYITYRGAMLGMTVSAGSHLFTLVDRDILIANLFIPQESLMKVRVGMKIEFGCDALPDESFAGKIRIINPVVDPATGTVKLRALLDKDEKNRLRPGMFITARIITSSRDDALLIPRKAVFYDDEKPTFFVIRAGDIVKKIHFKPTDATTDSLLEIGSLVTPDIEVDEGTRIVIVGQDNLKDGDKVRIVDETT